MQAPAIRFFDGYAVTSWQPLVSLVGVGKPGLPPSGNSTGSATTRAFFIFFFASGTFTTLMKSCGGWQSGKSALGEYDDT